MNDEELEQPITIPEAAQPPEAELEQQAEAQEAASDEVIKSKPKNPNADLFEIPQPEDNDIYSDDLIDVEDEDVFGGNPDMSDLTNVSNEDLMGEPKSSNKEKVYRYHRPRRIVQPSPPTSFGGMRG